MKSLYAKFMLFLIRPALDARDDERRQEVLAYVGRMAMSGATFVHADADEPVARPDLH